MKHVSEKDPFGHTLGPSSPATRGRCCRGSTLVVLVAAVIACLTAATSGGWSAWAAPAHSENHSYPRAPAPALRTGEPIQTAVQDELNIRVQQRGPYGELTAIQDHVIKSGKWGRAINLGTMTVVVRPISGLATRTLSIQITPKGYTLAGPTRPKGTLQFALPWNRRLHTIVGNSPGQLADIVATYGAPNRSARNAPHSSPGNVDPSRWF